MSLEGRGEVGSEKSQGMTLNLQTDSSESTGEEAKRAKPGGGGGGGGAHSPTNCNLKQN